MIIHVLLLEPKPETTREEMLAVLERVKALKEKIPGIVSLQAGENLNQFHQGYRYGFLMTFVDEAALKAYSPHPEHKAVSADLRRLSARLLNFDIPVD
ncbi:MAG: Dabb family protein [Ktedonobacteraceae bacterium]|nr:Dabb family protein [Ktedonobacteraceae bacterium]